MSGVLAMNKVASYHRHLALRVKFKRPELRPLPTLICRQVTDWNFEVSEPCNSGFSLLPLKIPAPAGGDVGETLEAPNLTALYYAASPVAN